MRNSAYIWTREFSCERLEKVLKIQRVWETLFGEPGDRGHYGRYQWLGAGWDGCRTGTAFPAPLDGKECQVHLHLVTTREWFARKIYFQAIGQTRARYPRFDERRFFDGQRVGERIVEFTSEEHDLAWGHLWTSLWTIIKEEKPTVSEATIVEECSDWGYPALVANTKRFGNEFTGNHRRITLVRNSPTVDEKQFSGFKALLKSGKLPGTDLTQVAFTLDEIRGGFIELSSPELVLLNWAEARPPHSEQDLKLIQSVDNLDLAGIGSALIAGANANTINQGNEPLISSLIGRWRDHEANSSESDENLSVIGGDRSALQNRDDEVLASIKLLLEHGAHPDLHGPDETTAIIDAALNCRYEIVELLLNRGANAAIHCHSDSSPGEWPQAWDSPHFDAFHENDREARRIYDLLILRRPSPLFRKELEDRDKDEALCLRPQREWNEFEPPFTPAARLARKSDPVEHECLFSYNHVIRDLPDDESVGRWIHSQDDTALAVACVHYAMAFNSLDESWLDGVLARSITYESQSVFEKLSGRVRVVGHLLAKLEAIQAMTESRPIFEIGLQSGAPCVIGYQQQEPDDKGWLDKPIANFTFELDEERVIKSILVVTVAPIPSTARGSGVYPGLLDRPDVATKSD
jgi:hypothetical protein